MTTQNLIRWSGAALMLAALLSLGYAVLGPDENTAGVFNHPNYVIANLLNTIRQGLLALGVIGLGLSLRGRLAAVGFLVMFFGTVLVVGLDVDKTFILPYLATVNPSITHMGNFAQNMRPQMQNYMLVFLVTLLLYFVGPVLLGIAILRDSRLPRWLGVVLIIGNIMQYGNMFGVAILHSIGVAVFGLALGWLGYRLWAWQTATNTITQPQLVH
jgi:hypothetical protein